MFLLSWQIFIKIKGRIFVQQAAWCYIICMQNWICEYRAGIRLNFKHCNLMNYAVYFYIKVGSFFPIWIIVQINLVASFTLKKVSSTCATYCICKLSSFWYNFFFKKCILFYLGTFKSPILNTIKSTYIKVFNLTIFSCIFTWN